jgi:acetylornithine deacetylase/succinyl-diaminopimelate desuccinylase-like protein
MEKVFDFIDKSSAIYVRELQALLRKPSVSADNEALKETAAMVKDLLQGISCNVEVIQPKRGRAPILYAKVSGDADKTLLFYNYYDVRSPGPLSEWDYQPFNAIIDAGKIYARGAADGKGDLVARMKAVEAFIKIREAPTLTVKFIVEGEAGIGSPTLLRVASHRPDMFRADTCIYTAGSRDDEGRLELTLTDSPRLTGDGSESDIARVVSEAVTGFYQRNPVVLRDSDNISPVVQTISRLGIPAVGLSIANNDSRAASSNENINTADFVDGIKLTAVIMQKLSAG